MAQEPWKALNKYEIVTQSVNMRSRKGCEMIDRVLVSNTIKAAAEQWAATHHPEAAIWVHGGGWVEWENPNEGRYTDVYFTRGPETLMEAIDAALDDLAGERRAA